MTDTARDIQLVETISTEGLDDIFSEVSATGDTEFLTATTADTSLWVTVTQAAAALNKSERTIQRYIKAGKLESREELGGKLFVLLPTTADTVSVVSPTFADMSHEVQAPADTRHDAADIHVGTVPIAELNKHLELIKELQNQVQAAAFRNGYLESKLEERDREIKLLTDSQHKPSWWQRFKAFFVKQ
ncbi:MAG: helix-turn-helix domain-containing protein [Candidatus Competibacteraceae bacterium]|nr:helix-turn-helix domain-containing protein [Candidatus Competibacteraceae bacterium]